jgi:alkylated DNA repair dioxygenase AlkB
MDKGESVSIEQSPFKAAEKKIRSYQHLSEALADGSVLDFSDPDLPENHSDQLYTAGSVQLSGVDMPFFAFHGYEGLFVIPDCLPVWQQLELAHFALQQAPAPPNNTNLTPAAVEGVWERERHLYDAMGPQEESYQPLPKTHVLGRLRWSSLGFQYDWTNRRYPQAAAPGSGLRGARQHVQEKEGGAPGDEGISYPGKDYGEDRDRISDDGDDGRVREGGGGGDISASSRPPVFPPRLATIIKDIVAAVPPAANIPSCAPVTIEPEASIVNYFPAGTTMGGHVDDAELTYEHPVVSLSLGKSCVFLIGGLTKDAAAPLAMVLRSGYVLLLHGESRLRMHGVAKVFPCPCGDSRRVQRVAGAAKSKSWRGHAVCECMCSSFDRDLEPCCAQSSGGGGGGGGEEEEKEKEGGAGHDPLRCHDNLGGVDCSRRQHDKSSEGESHCAENVGKRKEEEEEEEESNVCGSCSQPLLPAVEVERVKKFLKTARVNINVRQVYPIGTRPSFV